MWIPFAISSIVAVLFPSASPGSKKNGGSSTERSSSSSRSRSRQPESKSSSSRQLTTFTFGLVTGAGLGAYIMIQMRRKRIKERMRLFYRNWVIQEALRNAGEEPANGETESNSLLRIETSNIQIIRSNDEGKRPKRIRELFEGSGSGSTVQLLASPDTCLTPSMHASFLTITPQTKTRPKASNGAELYFVVEGTGEFMVDGEASPHYISGKDVVIINPWSIRSIENTGRENLIVIRVADEGHGYDEDNFDLVASQSAGVVLSGLVTDGLKTVNQYFNGKPLLKKCDSPRSVTMSGHEI